MNSFVFKVKVYFLHLYVRAFVCCSNIVGTEQEVIFAYFFRESMDLHVAT